MTSKEIKLITTICWKGKYQPLTIDMTNDNNTIRSGLGLNSKFLPDSSPFSIS